MFRGHKQVKNYNQGDEREGKCRMTVRKTRAC